RAERGRGAGGSGRPRRSRRNSSPAPLRPPAGGGSAAPAARTPPIPAQVLLVNQITMKWIFVYELTQKERDEAVGAITRLMQEKRLIHNVALTLPLGDIVRAHEAVEQGRTPGNVVVTLP